MSVSFQEALVEVNQLREAIKKLRGVQIELLMRGVDISKLSSKYVQMADRLAVLENTYDIPKEAA